MFSRDFEYTGYDGKPKKDTYFFNLNEAELYEIDLSSIHGFTGLMNKLLKEERTKEIVEYFKSIILGSVGVMSPDGRKFIKNEEIKEDFYRSKAYSMLFVELVSSGEKLAEFLKAAIPEDLRKAMEEKEKENPDKTTVIAGNVVSLPTGGTETVPELPDLPKRNDGK